MKKLILTKNINYWYDAKRVRKKYSFDGKKWYNAGEFLEIMLKSCLGFKPEKDENTAFNEGSDIQELNMSVKSSRAALCNTVLGIDLNTSLETYFHLTVSNKWAWVIDVEDTIHVYVMNKKEFEKFTRAWASYEKSTGRVRYKPTSLTMVEWFEQRL